MAHRVSLHVQTLLQAAAEAATFADRLVYASPVARRSEHMLAADYAAPRAKALEAIATLQAAVALMDKADRVQWVDRDGSTGAGLPDHFVYNRHGERVAVSIPSKE